MSVYVYQISRVPTGKVGGIYKNTIPENLIIYLLDGLGNISLDAAEGEFILAHSIGMMGNPARYAIFGSKLSNQIFASSIDTQCGGGYKGIQLAKALIYSGQRQWVIVGGVDSNSLKAHRNYHINDTRYNQSLDHIDTAQFSPNGNISMNESALLLAKEFEISKKSMQVWYAESHAKSLASFKRGFFAENVHYKGYSFDQTIKKTLTTEKLDLLETNQLIDRTTAADYCDGAGLMLLGSEKFGAKNGIKPIAEIGAVQTSASDITKSPFGVIEATQALLRDSNSSISDYEKFEVCESYAVKPLAFSKQFKVPLHLINSLGGNLAMGHPYAASFFINSLNLIKSLSQGKRGIVTAGVAGGMGLSVEIKKSSV